MDHLDFMVQEAHCLCSTERVSSVQVLSEVKKLQQAATHVQELCCDAQHHHFRAPLRTLHLPQGALAVIHGAAVQKPEQNQQKMVTPQQHRANRAPQSAKTSPYSRTMYVASSSAVRMWCSLTTRGALLLLQSPRQNSSFWRRKRSLAADNFFTAYILPVAIDRHLLMTQALKRGQRIAYCAASNQAYFCTPSLDPPSPSSASCSSVYLLGNGVLIANADAKPVRQGSRAIGTPVNVRSSSMSQHTPRVISSKAIARLACFPALRPV